MAEWDSHTFLQDSAARFLAICVCGKLPTHHVHGSMQHCWCSLCNEYRVQWKEYYRQWVCSWGLGPEASQ